MQVAPAAVWTRPSSRSKLQASREFINLVTHHRVTLAEEEAVEEEEVVRKFTRISIWEWHPYTLSTQAGLDRVTAIRPHHLEASSIIPLTCQTVYILGISYIQLSAEMMVKVMF